MAIASPYSRSTNLKQPCRNARKLKNKKPGKTGERNENPRKMKKTDEIVKAAPGYFKSYPKEDVFYATSDGNFFLGKDKTLAESHGRTIGEEPVKLERKDFEGGTVVIPEGDPTADWTKEQLLAYGAAKFPDLKLSKKAGVDNLLEKLIEAAKAAGGNGGGQ